MFWLEKSKHTHFGGGISGEGGLHFFGQDYTTYLLFPLVQGGTNTGTNTSAYATLQPSSHQQVGRPTARMSDHLTPSLSSSWVSSVVVRPLPRQTDATFSFIKGKCNLQSVPGSERHTFQPQEREYQSWLVISTSVSSELYNVIEDKTTLVLRVVLRESEARKHFKCKCVSNLSKLM